MTGGLKDRPYVDELLDLIQEEEKVSVGKTIPYVNLPNAKGTQISRTSFKDKYLLIHFWASWDPQSMEANAALRRIYKKEEKNKYSHSGAFPWISTERNGKKQSKEIP